jgi:hypothetical protein
LRIKWLLDQLERTQGRDHEINKQIRRLFSKGNLTRKKDFKSSMLVDIESEIENAKQKQSNRNIATKEDKRWKEKTWTALKIQLVRVLLERRSPSKEYSTMTSRLKKFTAKLTGLRRVKTATILQEILDTRRGRGMESIITRGRSRSKIFVKKKRG